MENTWWTGHQTQLNNPIELFHKLLANLHAKGNLPVAALKKNYLRGTLVAGLPAVGG